MDHRFERDRDDGYPGKGLERVDIESLERWKALVADDEGAKVGSWRLPIDHWLEERTQEWKGRDESFMKRVDLTPQLRETSGAEVYVGKLGDFRE